MREHTQENIPLAEQFAGRRAVPTDTLEVKGREGRGGVGAFTRSE